MATVLTWSKHNLRQKANNLKILKNVSQIRSQRRFHTTYVLPRLPPNHRYLPTFSCYHMSVCARLWQFMLKAWQFMLGAWQIAWEKHAKTC